MGSVGRKPLTTIGFAIAGVSLIIYPFISDYVIISYILLMIGKFGISLSFNLVILWSLELFPTEVKGSAYGISNLFGRAGGIISPLVSAALPRWFVLFFGSLSLASCFIAMSLKETKDQELDDVVSPKPGKSFILREE